MTLGDYLVGAARAPWAWGTHDCCTFAAGWAILQGHADPMAFIRGSYSSEMGALRAIAAGGGLVALWGRGMAEAGLSAVTVPRMGDIGVIATAEADGTSEVAAIFTGGRWAALAQRGLVCEPAVPLKVWRA